MHMEAQRFFIGQEHTCMMIELDEYHRTLNTVVKGAGGTISSDPAKMRMI